MELNKKIPPVQVTSDSNQSDNTLLAVKRWLLEHYDLRYNVVLSRNEFKLKNESEFVKLDDRTINSWYNQFKQQKRTLSKNDWLRLLYSEFVGKFDPFIHYFDSLPEWDQEIDYIQQLGATVTTETPELWQKHLKKWLVGAVANSILKGDNDLALVFSGAQGVGKTRWLNKLLPRSLSEYIFSGSLDPNNKDSRVTCTECFLINLDELEVTSRKEMASLKSLMSSKEIRERKAYRADAETMLRRASFVGSVNDPTFLVDATGSRRFLCHAVEQINYNHEVDMDKVYAQAYHLLKSGFVYYLEDEDRRELELSNNAFRVVSLEQECISKYFVPGVKDAPGAVFMNATALIQYLVFRGEPLKVDSKSTFAVGRAMTSMKFPRARKGDTYVYVLKLIDNSMNESELSDLVIKTAC